jgi:ribosome-interacting GTPase 1
VLRDADALVLCHDVTAPVAATRAVREELAAAGIDLPSLLAATKLDEAAPDALERLAEAFPELEVVGVSVLDDATMDAFRDTVWRLTGLLRVFARRPGDADAEPVALHPPATVADLARAIHGDLVARFRGARVWGPSARFEGQRVGREHELADGDLVEIVSG